MNHQEILNSDQAIPTDHGHQQCTTCGKTALRYWPCIRVEPHSALPYNPAEPYCEVCLIEAKTKLTIALGSQTPL